MILAALCKGLILWNAPGEASDTDGVTEPMAGVTASDLGSTDEATGILSRWAAVFRVAFAAMTQPDADLAQQRAEVLMAMQRTGVRLDTLAASGTTPAQLLVRVDNLADSADVQALLSGRGGAGAADVACRSRVCLAVLPGEGSDARNRKAVAAHTYARLPGPYQAVVDSAEEAATSATALAAEARSERSGMALPSDLARALLDARSDQRYVDAVTRPASQAEAYTFMLGHLGVSFD